MPYFILPVLWAFCICVGLVLLVMPPLRRTGIRLLLGSTGGLLGALGLSVALPLVTLFVLKILSRPTLDWLVGIAFLLGLSAGGILGSYGGVALAARVIRRVPSG